MLWINHLPPACWSTFWKSISKHQLGCRFDILESISSCFCILTYAIAIIYVLIHHIIFWLYLYFLNIIYFFKYSCTNIFHRRSLCTFYTEIDYSIMKRWLSDEVFIDGKQLFTKGPPVGLHLVMCVMPNQLSRAI